MSKRKDMSDPKLSEAQLQALRAWAQSGIDGSPEDEFWLRLLDEHAEQQKRIAELEAERDLLRAVADIAAADEVADGLDYEQELQRALDALAAHDARHGGGGDGQG